GPDIRPAGAGIYRVGSRVQIERRRGRKTRNRKRHPATKDAAVAGLNRRELLISVRPAQVEERSCIQGRDRRWVDGGRCCLSKWGDNAGVDGGKLRLNDRQLTVIGRLESAGEEIGGARDGPGRSRGNLALRTDQAEASGLRYACRRILSQARC